MLKKLSWTAVLILTSTALVPGHLLAAPDSERELSPGLAELSKRVEQWELSNGIQVVFFKRETAPVFAGQVWVKVGGVDEKPGITGIAHFLEHMAFKGTKTIGTKDFKSEEPLLNELENLVSTAPDQNTALASEKAEGLLQKLSSLWVDNELGRIYTKSGASSLNAMTSKDYTAYVVKLPSVSFELWCWMESDRILNPIFRQFYKEREVVQEERRRGYDDDPAGKLYEKLLENAFSTHPYRLPVIGYSSDLKQLTATQMKEFYKEHYRPSKIVISLVGNLDGKKVRDLTERYFGRLEDHSSGSIPDPAPEPIQTAQREITLELDAEPQIIMAYHKPTAPSPDDAYFSVLHSLLAEGRSSLFNKVLVEGERLAVAADTGEAPGERYDNLFMISLVPVQGVPSDQLINRTQKILDELQTSTASQELIEQAKKRSRLSFLKMLDSDDGLATILGKSQTIYGDWKEILRYFDKLESTSAEDLKNLSKKYLRVENRSLAVIKKTAGQK